jgi:hypothetical protein
MVKLVSEEEHDSGRDCDIRRDEIPPIERLLESCKTLNEEEEEVQEQVEAIDPDSTEGLEGVCG